MTGADYFIISILAVSSLVSLMRGFVKEALSLLVWIGAVLVAIKYSSSLAILFVDFITITSLRHIFAFIVLFITTLILGGFLNFLIGMLVRSNGLGGTDRILGLLFGFARGALIITVLVFLGGMTPVPTSEWWQKSMFIGVFENLALWLRTLLPSGMPLINS